MSDISSQLIKDSYNYVLQSDVSTGNIYRIGGGIPVNPIFLSGLTINSSFNFSNGSEQPGYVLTSDSSGNATWSPAGSSSGDYLPLSGGTVSGRTIFTSGLTANTISATTITTPFSGGSVLFAGTSGQISQNNSQLFWDNTNNRLGIGTNAPTGKLYIKQSADNSTDGIMMMGFNNTSTVRAYVNFGGLFTINRGGADVMGINTTGNVLIGTTTDSGHRLDVNGGTSRFSGNVTLSSQLNLPGNNFSGTYKILVNSQPSSGDLVSGTRNCIQDQVNFFNPNSGSSTVYNSFVASPTINQTNGSSGTTRGLYINPTLTSAYDFRAIETTNGKVIFGGTGNVLIGTTTDAGYKLDVNGNTRIQNTSYTGGMTLSQTANFTSVIAGGPASENITFGPSNRIFINAGQTRFPNGPVQMIGTLSVGSTNAILNHMLWTTGSITASSAVAKGIGLDTTLVAAANNDVLVGIDVQPTFTNGAFTGLTNIDLRTKNAGVVIGSGYGYGALYGYDNDGLVQIKTASTYKTQMWFRPSGNAGGYNSNYWSRIEHDGGNLNIIGSNYGQLSIASASGGGNGAKISFNGSTGIANNAISIEGPANSGRIALTTYLSSPIVINGGNLLVNTTTDAGFRLDVNGTARVSTSIQSSGFFTNAANGIGMNSPATAIRISTNDNGANIIGNNTPFFTFANNGTVINRTTGTGKWFEVASFVSFAPTTGNCTMDWVSVAPTINQTGGASGTTRGLYVNPTLTAAPDFRAIETTVGNVLLNTTSGNTLIGTTVDSGFKLNVSGNTNITGGLTATTISATTYQGVNRSFGVSFDGMGSVITVNSQSTLTIPYNMVIQSWVLLSDVTGSTVIDIWKDTYANYPPTSGDSITSLAKPSIVSGTKNQSSTLTGWNTIVNSGDIIRFNVDSCTGMTKATLTIIGKEF